MRNFIKKYGVFIVCFIVFMAVCLMFYNHITSPIMSGKPSYIKVGVILNDDVIYLEGYDYYEIYDNFVKLVTGDYTYIVPLANIYFIEID